MLGPIISDTISNIVFPKSCDFTYDVFGPVAVLEGTSSLAAGEITSYSSSLYSRTLFYLKTGSYGGETDVFTSGSLTGSNFAPMNFIGYPAVASFQPQMLTCLGVVTGQTPASVGNVPAIPKYWQRVSASYNVYQNGVIKTSGSIGSGTPEATCFSSAGGGGNPVNLTINGGDTLSMTGITYYALLPVYTGSVNWQLNLPSGSAATFFINVDNAIYGGSLTTYTASASPRTFSGSFITRDRADIDFFVFSGGGSLVVKDIPNGTTPINASGSTIIKTVNPIPFTANATTFYSVTASIT